MISPLHDVFVLIVELPFFWRGGASLKSEFARALLEYRANSLNIRQPKQKLSTLTFPKIWGAWCFSDESSWSSSTWRWDFSKKKKNWARASLASTCVKRGKGHTKETCVYEKRCSKESMNGFKRVYEWVQKSVWMGSKESMNGFKRVYEWVQKSVWMGFDMVRGIWAKASLASPHPTIPQPIHRSLLNISFLRYTSLLYAPFHKCGLPSERLRFPTPQHHLNTITTIIFGFPNP